MQSKHKIASFQGIALTLTVKQGPILALEMLTFVNLY